ncbi:hypothetical protein BGZ98_006661, partial [Dissophora globulifera]
VHSYIGVIIAIVGNILISVALNVQKYAHNQLLPGAKTEAKVISSNSTYFRENDTLNPHYDARQFHHSRPNPVYEDSSEDEDYYMDDREVRVNIQSSQNSRGSSTHSNQSVHTVLGHHTNHSDTSVQSDTIEGQVRAEVDEFYIAHPSVSDTEYLRSKAWWLGMTLMILGECGNFLAYGYAQASIVAPLGTVALVSNVILAPLMLKEPFRKRDLVGVVIAIIGTVVVVINSKENEIKLTPEAVVAALLQTQFIVYFILCCAAVSVLISLSHTIGSQYIFIDLSVVAIFGGYTVLATKGVSSLLSLSFYKMFTYPIAYLLVFVMVSTAVLQIKFLNKSLQRFDSTQVIPTQFVLFTASAIIGSGILYNDFDEMDFNKGFNFLTGCCMTFLGVYFITSHRDKNDTVTPATGNTEWLLSSQPHFSQSTHRPSIDSYNRSRVLYPQDRNRSNSIIGHGRTSVTPVQSTVPLNAPAVHPQRAPRYSIVPESLVPAPTSDTPLLETSHRQPIPGTKDQISFITNSVHNALATVGSAVGTHHTALLSLEFSTSIAIEIELHV